MKHLMKFAALAAIVLPMMVACGDKNKPTNNPVTLELSQTEFILPATGGTVDVTLLINVQPELKPENETAWAKSGIELKDDYYSQWFSEEEEAELRSKGYLQTPHELKLTFVVDPATSENDETYKFNVRGVVEIPVNGENYFKEASISITRQGLGEIEVPAGALKGLYSVAEGRQVVFSQGNLQYNKSTKKWSFARTQLEVLGKNQGNIIDLFCYGTSGYANAEPTLIDSEYEALNLNLSDIAGTEYDWGVNNAISNGGNQAGLWRTLTAEEWDYLLNGRPDAENLSSRYNGWKLAIFPDNWVAVKKALEKSIGKQWEQATEAELTEAGVLLLSNETMTNYWNSNYSNQIIHGCYWTSTAVADDDGAAQALNIDFDQVTLWNQVKSWGHAVRLVADVK